MHLKILRGKCKQLITIEIIMYTNVLNVLVLYARIITYPDMCPLPILIYIHYYIFLLHGHSCWRQNNARYMGYYTCNHSTLGNILELVTNTLMVAFKTKWYNYNLWWNSSDIVNEVYIKPRVRTHVILRFWYRLSVLCDNKVFARYEVKHLDILKRKAFNISSFMV